VKQRAKLLQAIGRWDWALMEQIVGEAQNGPPHGSADGSISEHEWNAASDLVKAHQLFLRARLRFMEVWRTR
jgi:hypothetical protein